MEYPARKPNRLRKYDYSLPGAYFVTICTQNRRCVFWANDKERSSDRNHNVGADIIRPQLSRYGEIAERAIRIIPEHYPGVEVDTYVIMPNHIHLILWIREEHGRIISAPTVSTVIGQMKRTISKQIGHPIWQKSFHDHVIRNEDDLREIRAYIAENPAKWREDRLFTELT